MLLWLICIWVIMNKVKTEIELTEDGEVKWLIGACGGYVLIGISWGRENE